MSGRNVGVQSVVEDQFWRWMVVMVAQQHEGTQSHWTIYTNKLLKRWILCYILPHTWKHTPLRWWRGKPQAGSKHFQPKYIKNSYNWSTERQKYLFYLNTFFFYYCLSWPAAFQLFCCLHAFCWQDSLSICRNLGLSLHLVYVNVK